MFLLKITVINFVKTIAGEQFNAKLTTEKQERY